MSSWDEEIKKTLGSCGKNVFIGKYCTFTNPQNIHLGDNVRIDPYTLITTGLKTGNNVQIMANAVLSGGSEHTITLGDWTFIGYGSKLFCASEDYSGKHGAVNEFWGSNKAFHGDIEFKDYSGIASDVMVMNGVTLPEGCTIGAMSLVRNSCNVQEWEVRVGNPLLFHKKRNKEKCLEITNSDDYIKEKYR